TNSNQTLSSNSAMIGLDIPQLRHDRPPIPLDELRRHPPWTPATQFDTGKGGVSPQQSDSIARTHQLEAPSHAQLAVPTDDPGRHLQLFIDIGRRQVVDFMAYHHHGAIELLILGQTQ